MPYARNSDVPKQKNTKTAKQKRAFRKTFNNVVERGGTEESAFAIANSSASKSGEKEKKAKKKGKG